MSNSYESGAQKMIPAVLVYLKFQSDVLMLHRLGRANDYHQGKWNGLGGKLEKGESPFDAAIREVQEESGITLQREDLKVVGHLYFPNFKPHLSEDWSVTVLTAKLLHAPDLTPSPEGELRWIPSADVMGLNLWEGDRLFLPYVLSKTPFFGTVFYEGQKVSRAEVAGV